MHSYWISNCRGLVALEGLSSTLTLVTEMAVMLPVVGRWALRKVQMPVTAPLATPGVRCGFRLRRGVAGGAGCKCTRCEVGVSKFQA